MSKLKVLWLAPHPIPNKSNMHPTPWITSLACELSKEGANITVVTTAKRLPKPIMEYQMIGYKLIILNVPSGYIDVLTLFRERMKIINRFVSNEISNYSLIHIHGTEFQFATSVKNLKSKIPIIISIQGIIFECKKYIKDLISIRRIMWEICSIYEKKELKGFDYFFCRTHWDTSCVLKQNSKAKIFDVWEMLRDEFYKFQINKLGKNILFAGGDQDLKGIAICLRVFNRLILFDSTLVLHIIGSCRPASVEKIIRKYNLRELNVQNIRIHGRLSAKEILAVYSDCFCLYHPSIIDNSPNTICEAQLAGLPVIATDVGGVSSLIDNYKTGLLVRLNDIEAHLNEIKNLQKDKLLQKHISEKSRIMAVQRHNPSSIVSKTIEAYKSIVFDNLIH